MKPSENITLGKLAFAHFVYLAPYESDSWQDSIGQTGNNLNLECQQHRNALLEFLNKWNCRIKKDDNPLFHRSIRNWYSSFFNNLPEGDRNLWELTEEEIRKVGCAYGDLSKRPATDRKSFGQAPTAKILFAIRPKSLMAWDKEIRKHYVGQNGAYTEFIKKMQDLTCELKEQCRKHNSTLGNLPRKLGCPDFTVPKLIDEYNWITITKNCKLPDKKTLEKWIKWSN